MDLQQTPQYINYIKLLKWRTVQFNDVYCIYRHFPLVGSLMKIQRSEILPDPHRLIRFCREKNIRLLAVEPASKIKSEKLKIYLGKIKNSGIKISRTPFLSTKSLLVDINISEDKLFSSFSSAKRRGVRKAMKNSLVVLCSDNIDEIIRIKSKAAGFMGFITTHGLRELNLSFAQDNNAESLIAYQKSRPDKALAGIFMLYHGKTATYWIAGSGKTGKKLHAPTLLVWQAMLNARKRKCKTFDFLGVWDERLPKLNVNWKGFTKFKEGFGGKAVYYPINE